MTSAKAKLITTVVSVKNILTAACFHLWYENENRGTAPSMIQNKVIPPAKISARCVLGIWLKYSIKFSSICY
jgi:hypothetical protein